MKETTTPWWEVKNIDDIDSPALLVYEERVKENIRFLIDMVSDTSHLRPHVKTNKMAEVCALMMEAGISKFKCATIAEAEMLAIASAPDVLLAYQPVGPKINRFIQLIQAYPATHFACLTDNVVNARLIAEKAGAASVSVDVFIDLNVGMNRTGIKSADAMKLVDCIHQLPQLKLSGLHGYDGHIRDTDLTARQHKSDDGFSQVLQLEKEINIKYPGKLSLVIGGSPSFPTHALRKGIECSPGTFIFWDWGYKHQLPDEPFEYAALVISRVISIVDGHTICTDLGHKSVAAENPLPRVHFLNAPDAVPVAQSEEHLVLKVPDAAKYQVGDVLYGVPVHICPTVALYDQARIVRNQSVVTSWKVVARDRSIHI
jgi:D-serine deaminase-like pyridoxal phosphate-dependent protein